MVTIAQTAVDQLQFPVLKNGKNGASLHRPSILFKSISWEVPGAWRAAAEGRLGRSERGKRGPRIGATGKKQEHLIRRHDAFREGDLIKVMRRFGFMLDIRDNT